MNTSITKEALKASENESLSLQLILEGLLGGVLLTVGIGLLVSGFVIDIIAITEITALCMLGCLIIGSAMFGDYMFRKPF